MVWKNNKKIRTSRSTGRVPDPDAESLWPRQKEKSGWIGRYDKRTGLNVLDTLTKNNNNKNLVARTDPVRIIAGQKLLHSKYYSYIYII